MARGDAPEPDSRPPQDDTHLKQSAVHTIDATVHAVRQEGHYAGVRDTVSGESGKILQFLLHFLEDRHLLALFTVVSTNISFCLVS